MKNPNLLHDHDLSFSGIPFPMKFLETHIKFKKMYAVAPQVNVWIEAISPDIPNKDFPYFSMPPRVIRNDGFTLFHTEFDWAKFKVHYRVYEVKLEELERGSL